MNMPASPLPAPQTLGWMVYGNALARPDAPALITSGGRLSFAEMASRADTIAAGLYDMGLRHQDRVAILAQNSLEFCELYAGCERGGFILATVNFRLAAPEIAHVINDSAARVLVFDAHYAPTIAALRNDLPVVEHFVAIGNGPNWARRFEELRSDAPAPACTASDIGFIIYTSGTTGKPKGCMIGQREEVEKARITSADVRISAMDRILLTMPLFHIGAKAMLNAQHWMGGCAYLHRDFDPVSVLEAVERDRITILHLAPTMVQMLLEVSNIEDYDLSSLRAIVYSASAMPFAVLQKGISLFGSIFYQIYGLTEGIGTILSPEDHIIDGNELQTKRLRSIGLPSPGVRLKIGTIDQEEPIGVPGEILMSTPAVARGYWNNSAASIELLRGGWMHTGDVGYRDTDGYIYLVDRKKDMIVSGGENIYSREVEEALYLHEAVREAAVIGVPDAKWGEAVRAVIALRPGQDVDGATLIAHVRTLIASYKKPRDVVFVEALPKTANGKIDKQSLRRLHGMANIALSAL